MKWSVDKNTHQSPENTAWSKKIIGFQWTKCFRFLEVWRNKVSTTFTNRTVSRKMKSSVDETLNKVQKTLIEAKTFLDSNETNCLRFLGAFWNQIFLALSNQSAWRRRSTGLVQTFTSKRLRVWLYSNNLFPTLMRITYVFRTLICNCTAQKIMPSLYSTSLSLPMFCRLEKKVVKFHGFCFRVRKESFQLAYQSIATRSAHLARQT